VGKRANREGSIYRRGADGRWVAVIHLGYESGKRVRKAIYAKSQAEARDKLRAAQQQHEQGMLRRDDGRTVGHSVRANLETETWPGTGRLVRMKLYGITVRELVGRSAGPLFINRLARANLDLFGLPPEPPDLRGYLDLALRSSFPACCFRRDSNSALAPGVPHRTRGHGPAFSPLHGSRASRYRGEMLIANHRDGGESEMVASSPHNGRQVVQAKDSASPLILGRLSCRQFRGNGSQL
jgi:hypothetical protein